MKRSNPGPSDSLSNFPGISVSGSSIDGDNGYTKFLTTANTQAVNLFKQIGIKHLRTIMGNAQSGNPDPSNSQIDSFFDFAAAAGVNKIIWSLHLDNAEVTTNWANNKAVATHIWSTTTAHGTVESNLLESFAFDNEPDWLRYICCTDPNITGYSTPAGTGGYSGMWSQWRQTIAGLAPGAKFSGPDTGSKWPCPGEINTSVGGVPFTLRFATDKSSLISMATQHFYGQTGISNFTTLQLAEACLSSNWLATNYTVINNDIVGSLAMPYRFTECSAFDNETNAGNQCFATGLGPLDFYHWWACHGPAPAPVPRLSNTIRLIYFDGTNYIAEPHAYATQRILARWQRQCDLRQQFLGQQSRQYQCALLMAVNSSDLFVTVVNKTFNSVSSRTASITIPAPNGFLMRTPDTCSCPADPSPVPPATRQWAAPVSAARSSRTTDHPGRAPGWLFPSPTVASASSVPATTAVIIDLQNYPLLSAGAPPMDAAGLHLSASAPAGSNAVVQVSTNLAGWTPIYTNTGSFTFADPKVTNAPRRFYRLLMQ